MWVLQGSRGIKRGVLHRYLMASNVSRRSDAGPKKASVPRTFSRAGEDDEIQGNCYLLINPPKNQWPRVNYFQRRDLEWSCNHYRQWRRAQRHGISIHQLRTDHHMRCKNDRSTDSDV